MPLVEAGLRLRIAFFVQHFPDKRRLRQEIFNIVGIAMPGEEIHRGILLSGPFQECPDKLHPWYARAERGPADLDFREFLFQALGRD